MNPEVGDFVIETTHAIGLARYKLGVESAVGELVGIEPGPFGKTYTIKGLSGDLQKWENAMIVVLEKAHKDAVNG